MSDPRWEDLRECDDGRARVTNWRHCSRVRRNETTTDNPPDGIDRMRYSGVPTPSV